MPLAIFSHLRTYWPFSIPSFDDLKASHQLVRKLSLPDHTKQFVFAVREPHSQAVIYILAAQNLSERSASDAVRLIGAARPDAVVAQVPHSAATAAAVIEAQEGSGHEDVVPTTAFGVLRRCFLDKVSREKYENVAGGLVLRDIFGVGFHEHFFAAKRAAEDAGSAFLLLDSPCLKSASVEDSSEETESGAGSKFQGLGFHSKSLVPEKVGTAVSVGCSRRLLLTHDSQARMVKLLSPYVESSVPLLRSSDSVESANAEPSSDYTAPPFAQLVYPLLVDLHNVFADLPSIGKALTHAQKIFYDVSRGENVDHDRLCEVYTFRIAIEGLRIALNNAARLPINRMESPKSDGTKFSELSVEEKSHALFAQALRSQTEKFKTVVAVVDASCLAGLRKHWNTPVPPEVKDMVGELVAHYEADEEILQSSERKRLLSKKSVVAVGAGATAAIGVSSMSKVVPASTVIKFVTFKAPTSLKLISIQTQKAVGIALKNYFLPSKIIAPGIASSGASTSFSVRAAASAEKIRIVAHGVIASAEKTSLSAMRTAFYEIMRKRRVQPVGVLPWATFGCSLATCAGLFAYGDGIECAAESLPAASSIASLGRGIRSLHQASEAVSQLHGIKIQTSIESLMYRLKRVRLQ